MLENVIRRVRRLLLSGYYVVSEDWPAGNFRRWHSGTTLRSRFRLSDGGLALAFIRPFLLVIAGCLRAWGGVCQSRFVLFTAGRVRYTQYHLPNGPVKAGRRWGQRHPQGANLGSKGIDSRGAKIGAILRIVSPRIVPLSLRFESQSRHCKLDGPSGGLLAQTYAGTAVEGNSSSTVAISAISSSHMRAVYGIKTYINCHLYIITGSDS